MPASTSPSQGPTNLSCGFCPPECETNSVNPLVLSPLAGSFSGLLEQGVRESRDSRRGRQTLRGSSCTRNRQWWQYVIVEADFFLEGLRAFHVGRGRGVQRRAVGSNAQQPQPPAKRKCLATPPRPAAHPPPYPLGHGPPSRRTPIRRAGAGVPFHKPHPRKPVTLMQSQGSCKRESRGYNVVNRGSGGVLAGRGERNRT